MMQECSRTVWDRPDVEALVVDERITELVKSLFQENSREALFRTSW
jgi:hypothetical protein